MKINMTRLAPYLMAAFALCGALELNAQTTAFTYQGQLNDGASPANGIYDLQFTIYDAVTGGAAVAGPLTNATTNVSGGLFTVTLDFGASVFTGADRWLDVAVRTNGSVSAYQALAPRQPLTSTPYAVRAANFSGAVSDGQLSANVARLNASQSFSGVVNFSNAANSFAGAFTGNGAGLTNVPGAVPLQVVAGASAQALPNMGYVATNDAQVAISLPTNASVGDVVQVNGVGAGGWRIEPVSEHFINGYQTGVAWTAREYNRSWYSLSSSADGRKLVAVVSGGQIYTSTDSGSNWTPRGTSQTWWSVASSADGSKLVAVVLNGQIYTSTDSGTNWIARESSRNWVSVASSADGNKLVAVVLGSQIYTSTDSGTNWTARESARNWYSVASSADGSKVVAVVSGFGQIYTSTDSGTNWIARENNRGWTSVASSADGSKLVAGVQYGQIYTSTDSGTNWTARESTRYWDSVASSADGSKLVAGVNGGQIYTSTDSGTNWTARQSNRNWISVASSADGRKLVAGVNGGQIYTSTTTPLVGAQGSTIELQYAGADLWQPLDVSQSANAPNTIVLRDANGNFAAGSVAAAGNITANGSISATDFSWSSGGSLSDNQGGTIELGDSLQPGVTPFIDFHYGTGSAQDYSVRLINDAANRLSLYGNLAVNGTVTATSFSGSGAGLTLLNAANLAGSVPSASLTTVPAANLTGSVPSAALTSVPVASLTGTIADARLSTNVALLNSNQTFTGQNTFSNSVSGGGVTLDASSTSGAFNLKNGSGLRSSLGLATLAGNYSADAAVGDTVLRASAGKLLLQAGSGASAIAISASNLVGIGKTNPATLLDVGGTVTVTTLGVGTTNPATALHVASSSGDAEISIQSGDAGGHRWTLQSTSISTNIALNSSFQIIDRTVIASRLLIDTNGNVGMGITPTNRLHVNGGVSATAFVTTSDRNAKENFAPVSPQEVLSKVVALPITTWNFKTMNDGRHMGPMAQDFHAAFGLGGGDTTITSVDPDGVALAAIQGLNQKLEQKETEITELQERLEKLETLLNQKLNGGTK